MTYLFDTDILSNLLRRAPSTALVARLALVPPDEQFTSVITLGELYYGALHRPEQAAVLLPRIEGLSVIQRAVLPFDATAARRYGELRAHLERLGTPIGDADTRIAAIALTRGLTMVTANARHYGRVPGLTVENWLV